MSDEMKSVLREPYTLKELIAKNERGDLDDLTTAEVRELNAFTRFAAQTQAEIAANNTLAAIEYSLNEKVDAARAEMAERVAQLAREGIVTNFLEALEKVDEQAANDIKELAAREGETGE